MFRKRGLREIRRRVRQRRRDAADDLRGLCGLCREHTGRGEFGQLLRALTQHGQRRPVPRPVAVCRCVRCEAVCRRTRVRRFLHQLPDAAAHVPETLQRPVKLLGQRTRSRGSKAGQRSCGCILRDVLRILPWRHDARDGVARAPHRSGTAPHRGARERGALRRGQPPQVGERTCGICEHFDLRDAAQDAADCKRGGLRLLRGLHLPVEVCRELSCFAELCFRVSPHLLRDLRVAGRQVHVPVRQERICELHGGELRGAERARGLCSREACRLDRIEIVVGIGFVRLVLIRSPAIEHGARFDRVPHAAQLVAERVFRRVAPRVRLWGIALPRRTLRQFSCPARCVDVRHRLPEAAASLRGAPRVRLRRIALIQIRARRSAGGLLGPVQHVVVVIAGLRLRRPRCWVGRCCGVGCRAAVRLGAPLPLPAASAAPVCKFHHGRFLLS